MPETNEIGACMHTRNYNFLLPICRELLQQYPGAEECRQYLDGRLSPASQNHFGFGYFPNTAQLEVLLSQVDRELLIEGKLIYPKDIEDTWCVRHWDLSYFDQYPLVMPYRNQYGDAMGIVGRTLVSEGERKKLEIAKYKNTCGLNKGQLLYGLYENWEQIVVRDRVWVVEGQFDVIKAWEAGIGNVVAIGCSHLTAYQFSLLRRYTKNIYLLLDNDEAGEKGSLKALQKFGEWGGLKRGKLGGGAKDLDEWLGGRGGRGGKDEERGDEALLELI